MRCVSNQSGDRRLLQIKCPLTDLGRDLNGQVAAALEVELHRVVKCISAGRLVDPDRTLLSQNLRNNQQLMVILAETKNDGSTTSLGESEAMYDRISKIRRDVETIADSNERLIEVFTKVAKRGSD